MAPQHLSATSFLSFSKRILRNQGARDCPLTFVSLPFLSLSLLVRDKFCLYLSSLLLSESSFSLQPRLPGEARPHGQTESKHRTFVKLRHVGMSIEGSNPNLMQTTQELWWPKTEPSVSQRWFPTDLFVINRTVMFLLNNRGSFVWALCPFTMLEVSWNDAVKLWRSVETGSFSQWCDDVGFNHRS